MNTVISSRNQAVCSLSTERQIQLTGKTFSFHGVRSLFSLGLFRDLEPDLYKFWF